MIDVASRGDAHAEGRDFVERRVEILEALTQLPAVERRGTHGAAASSRTRRMAVKIRHRIAIDEGKPGFAFEEGNHARSLLEEHCNARFVVAIAEFVAKVGTGSFGILLDTGRLRQRIARDPE